jgi:transcription antitermination protein NusB
MSRRLARETALQVLFQMDMAGEKPDIPTVVRHWAEEFAVPETSIPFAQELVEGTLSHLEEIDTKLGQLSEGWAVSRMANVDRNLLRLACYEILYREDIPGRVTINEALEIAKRYGSEESGKFINGILDRIIESVNKKEEKK